MCGLLAYFSQNTHDQTDNLNLGLAKLNHRGPDHKGIWQEKTSRYAITLAHSRLAITGIENGEQPLVSSSCAAIVNGEFYGWSDIKSGLERNGAVFSTFADSEILPHMFDQESDIINILSKLKGEWCFILWDKKNQVLWAACDPFGTKPLRWWCSENNREFAIASEAKAIFPLGAKREIDLESLDFSMRYQYLPWGRTLFKNIRMLPAGTLMRVEMGKSPELIPWWNPVTQTVIGKEKDSFAAKEKIEIQSKQEILKTIRDSVKSAVIDRIPLEVKFCTHLSGGIDSTLVTAIAAEINPGISGYCASFPWAIQGDETALARENALGISAHFNPVEIEEYELLTAFDQSVYHSEGLSINLHAGAKMLVSQKIARDGYKVVLTGEGADEAFLGYEHFRDDMPEELRPINPSENPLSQGLMRASKNISESNQFDSLNMPSWLKIKTSSFAELHKQNLNKFENQDFLRFVPEILRKIIEDASAIDKSKATWINYALSSYILRGLDDATGMASSIESRIPFLDARLQLLAASIPAELHWDKKGLEKSLLRQAFQGFVPDPVLFRPKRAFLAPAPFQRKKSMDWLKDHLLTSPITHLGFNPAYTSSLIDQPQTPVRDAKLLTLVSLDQLVKDYKLA